MKTKTDIVFPHETLAAYGIAQRLRSHLLGFDSLKRCLSIRRQLDSAALRVMLSLADAGVAFSDARRRRVLNGALVACAKCAVLVDAAEDSGALAEGERSSIRERIFILMMALQKLIPTDDPVARPTQVRRSSPRPSRVVTARDPDDEGQAASPRGTEPPEAIEVTEGDEVSAANAPGGG